MKGLDSFGLVEIEETVDDHETGSSDPETGGGRALAVAFTGDDINMDLCESKVLMASEGANGRVAGHFCESDEDQSSKVILNYCLISMIFKTDFNCRARHGHRPRCAGVDPSCLRDT
jgi:hypothetical protein